MFKFTGGRKREQYGSFNWFLKTDDIKCWWGCDKISLS